jgi:hypothetical protein
MLFQQMSPLSSQPDNHDQPMTLDWLKDALRGLEDIGGGRVVDADTALQALQERRMKRSGQRQDAD